MRIGSVNGFDEWVKRRHPNASYTMAELEDLQEAFHGGIIYGEMIYREHVEGLALEAASKWVKEQIGGMMNSISDEALRKYYHAPELVREEKNAEEK